MLRTDNNTNQPTRPAADAGAGGSPASPSASGVRRPPRLYGAFLPGLSLAPLRLTAGGGVTPTAALLDAFVFATRDPAAAVLAVLVQNCNEHGVVSMGQSAIAAVVHKRYALKVNAQIIGDARTKLCGRGVVMLDTTGNCVIAGLHPHLFGVTLEDYDGPTVGVPLPANARRAGGGTVTENRGFDALGLDAEALRAAAGVMTQAEYVERRGRPPPTPQR